MTKKLSSGHPATISVLYNPFRQSVFMFS